jgi:hypothetical protein
VICGQPIPGEWVEVVKVGSAKDVFFRRPTVFLAHEECLRKMSFPGFLLADGIPDGANTVEIVTA